MRRRRASARRAFSSGITGWERLGIAATETVVWGCLGFSILLADLVFAMVGASPYSADSRQGPSRFTLRISSTIALSSGRVLPLDFHATPDWKNG